LAARIQTYVFDKTGTLTELGLSVLGFAATNQEDGKNSFLDFATKIQQLSPANWWKSE
jgi:cation transport ATPase